MTIFTIRIVYKSGYTQDFECTKFVYERNTYSGRIALEWAYYGDGPKPLGIGSDDIAAVWEMSKREVKDKK